MAAGGRKIQLLGREFSSVRPQFLRIWRLIQGIEGTAYANESSKSTSISTTTSPVTVPPGPYDLMKCPEPEYGGPEFNCYREGDPYARMDLRSPYNTTAFPYNIIPPNDMIASQCAISWTSKASIWLSTASLMTNTMDQVSIWYPENFDWTPSPPCCLNCTMLGGNGVQVMVWPTPAPTPPVATLINSNNYTL